MKDRYHVIAEKFLYSECSEVELEELQNAISEDPQLVDAIADELAMTGLLSSSQKTENYFDGIAAEIETKLNCAIPLEIEDDIRLFVSSSQDQSQSSKREFDYRDKAVSLPSPLKPYQPKKNKSILRYLPLALSACLLLGITYFLVSSLEKDKVLPVVPIAEVIEHSTDGVVDENGEQNQQSKAIYNGDRISTDAKSSMLIKLSSDDSRFTLKPNTEVIFRMNEGVKTLFLSKGAVYCDIDKQPNSKPLFFETPEAVVTVLGTAFTLSKAEEGTKVEMDEGSVNVKSIQQGNQTNISAGEVAEVLNTGELRYQAFDGSNDFESGTTKGLIIEGDFPALIQDREEYLVSINYNKPFYKQGKYFLSTIDSHGDDSSDYTDAYTGKITSENFVLSSPYLNLLVAGGTNRELIYFGVYLSDGTEISRISNDRNGESFVKRRLDLRNYLGESVYWQIVDKSKAGWGWISVDDIHFSDK